MPSHSYTHCANTWLVEVEWVVTQTSRIPRPLVLFDSSVQIPRPCRSLVFRKNFQNSLQTTVPRPNFCSRAGISPVVHGVGREGVPLFNEISHWCHSHMIRSSSLSLCFYCNSSKNWRVGGPARKLFPHRKQKTKKSSQCMYHILRRELPAMDNWSLRRESSKD